jgi:predicted ester cyclase
MSGPMTDIWVCGSCHSLNRLRAARCYKCGAAQKTTATGDMATHRQEQAIAMRWVVPYRPAAALGMVASFFLLGVAAISVTLALESLRFQVFANQQFDLLATTGRMDEAAYAAVTLGLVRLAIILPTLLFFAAWLSRVVANVPALGGGVAGTSPWRAFSTTLIPILNLRTVPGTIQDVLYRLDPKAGGFFMVAVAWVGLVGSWLIAVIASRYLTLRVVFDLSNANSRQEALDAARGLVTAATIVDLATAVMIAAGAVVLILLMIRIERRARARDAEIRQAAGSEARVGDDRTAQDRSIQGRLGRAFDPVELRRIKRLWVRHSIAEDRRDIDGLIATLAPTSVYELIPTGQRWDGHEGARAFYTELFAAFPDNRFALTEIVVGPQGVFEVATLTGTNVGPWGGAPPSGLPVSLQVLILFPWDRATGRFLGERIWFDRGTLADPTIPVT